MKQKARIGLISNYTTRLNNYSILLFTPLLPMIILLLNRNTIFNNIWPFAIVEGMLTGTFLLIGLKIIYFAHFLAMISISVEERTEKPDDSNLPDDWEEWPYYVKLDKAILVRVDRNKFYKYFGVSRGLIGNFILFLTLSIVCIIVWFILSPVILLNISNSTGPFSLFTNTNSE